MRAAIYARISRDEEDQRAGVDRQLVSGAEVAAGHGWNVVQTFTDNDMSAFSGERPGFEALCKAIENGQLDAVIVQHQDRIARNDVTWQRFRDLVVAHDVRVEKTRGGPIDLISATGRYQANIQAATDQHYSALISEKAQDAHAAIAKRGAPNGGRRPFGYERTSRPDGERTFTPHPVEAPLVKEIFKRFLAPSSIRSIALDLDARGFVTAGGAKWSTGRVRDILDNPLYAGIRVHKGARSPGNWPALIDSATFETSQAILNSRRKPAGRGLRKYCLAGGLTRCGVCGTALVARPQRGKRRYGCPPDKEGSCGGIGIQAIELEDQIRELLADVLTDPEIKAFATGKTPDNALVLAEIKEVEARRHELAEAFALGEIDRGQLVTATARLDSRRDVLRSQLVDVRTDFDVGEVREAWAVMGVEWKAGLASTLIGSIIIHPAVPGRTTFDQRRVQIVWRIESA